MEFARTAAIAIRLTLKFIVIVIDLASIVLTSYPKREIELPNRQKNNDPGRLRHELVFKAAYGSNESEARKNVVEVEFLGQKTLFDRRNGAARALYLVGVDLNNAIKTDLELKAFLQPWITKKQVLNDQQSGDSYTFFWRNIKGTSRISNHSFETAIDLLTENSNEPYYRLPRIF